MKASKIICVSGTVYVNRNLECEIMHDSYKMDFVYYNKITERYIGIDIYDKINDNYVKKILEVI